MRYDNRSTQVSSINIGCQKRSKWTRERRKLGCADEVEKEEDSENKGESERDEAWVDEDGWKEHGNHHSVENFAARVDFNDSGEVKYNCQADKEDDYTVDYENKTGVSRTDSGG